MYGDTYIRSFEVERDGFVFSVAHKENQKSVSHLRAHYKKCDRGIELIRGEGEGGLKFVVHQQGDKSDSIMGVEKPEKQWSDEAFKLADRMLNELLEYEVPSDQLQVGTAFDIREDFPIFEIPQIYSLAREALTLVQNEDGFPKRFRTFCK